MRGSSGETSLGRARGSAQEEIGVPQRQQKCHGTKTPCCAVGAIRRLSLLSRRDAGVGLCPARVSVRPSFCLSARQQKAGFDVRCSRASPCPWHCSSLCINSTEGLREAGLSPRERRGLCGESAAGRAAPGNRSASELRVGAWRKEEELAKRDNEGCS